MRRATVTPHVKARADFFFSEQCKRLGPITTITPVLPVLDAHSPVRKRGRPRKSNPKE